MNRKVGAELFQSLGKKDRPLELSGAKPQPAAASSQGGELWLDRMPSNK